MRSLNEGETPMRGVRVPDELWARVERWAATRGNGVSDALRGLLEKASAEAPSTGLVVRPPLRWMERERHHDCFRKRRRYPSAPCGEEWAHRPEEWAFVSVLDGGPHPVTDYDLMCSLVSYRCGHPGHGYAGWDRVPVADLELLARAFNGREDRLRVHHLVDGEGPRLLVAEGE